MATNIRRVGIVGLGKMGLPMARHLRNGGFAVAACDVNAAARTQAEAAGIKVVANPKAVAAESDFIIVVVGFDAEAEAVVLGPDGIATAARPGMIVGIASTVAPRTMQKIAGKISGSGIVLLDMPITRGEAAAEAGKMLTMVGGDVTAFEACKGALATFASSIYHVGDLGSGQVGKMVNNLILWACISANYEGFKIGEKLGVDREAMKQMLLDSSAQNWAMGSGAGDRPMPWAEKDMMIVLEEADAARISLPLCGSIKEVIKGIKVERGE